MEVVIFKTDINNEAALKLVAPHIDKAVGLAKWQLDISKADKLLTVYSPVRLNETELLKAIRKAGFYAIILEDDYCI